MVRVLAFDTATPVCAVAITEGSRIRGRVAASLTLGGLTHSRRLLASIDQLMRALEIGWHDLDGIAVGTGPGSFTGLRIGMATAKGLAFAAGLPLLGFSTLDVLAAGAPLPPPGSCLCATVDARKKEVYACFYSAVDGRVEAEGEPVVLGPKELAKSVDKEVLFVGDGARLYDRLLSEEVPGRARFAPAQYNLPSAEVLGFLGAEQLERDGGGASAEVLPCYVRKSDAELNLARKKREECGDSTA